MAEPVEIQLAYRVKSRPVRFASLAALATKQDGVVGHRQLLRLGFSRASVQRLVAGKHLHALHHGVYAVGHSSVSVRGRWIAALLAGGPGAVLSHATAAAVWDLRDGVGPVIHVTTARSRGRRDGIRFHQVRKAHPEDWTRRNGLPVTSVARVLLDLAAESSLAQLGRLVERAERLRLFDAVAIQRVLSRAGGHRGRRPLGEVVAGQSGPPPDTRSELERRFLELCIHGGLARPALNVTVAGFEVDALWPMERVVVELDGFEVHRTREAFERDRARDAVLQTLDYKVLRFTDRRLKCQPEAVLAGIRSLISGVAPAT